MRSGLTRACRTSVASPSRRGVERLVERERGVDQGEVGERLREVADLLAGGAISSEYRPTWLA